MRKFSRTNVNRIKQSYVGIYHKACRGRNFFMKQLITIISLTAVIIFVTCKKDTKQLTTLSGHIYKDCSKQPLANTEIVFFQPVSSDLLLQTSGGIVGTATTDLTGYFKASFMPVNNNALKIQEKVGLGYNTLMEGVPGNVEGLKIYEHSATNIQVLLNVINSYSANDTLYITNFNNLNEKMKITGPFNTGILYNTNKYPLASLSYYADQNNTSLGYKINSGNWIIKNFNLVPCDTVKVTVNIQ